MGAFMNRSLSLVQYGSEKPNKSLEGGDRALHGRSTKHSAGEAVIPETSAIAKAEFKQCHADKVDG